MTAPLIIGFDGRAFSSPAAGVRRYVRGLVPALLGLEDAPQIVVLGGRKDAVPDGARHVGAVAHPPSNLGWMLVGLPGTAARARVDLIHAPAYTAPLWTRVPVVVSIHDVSYERHPEWYPYRRDRVRRAFYRHSARRAAHVITDSEFSAREIHAAYAIRLDDITVAPLGVEPAFTPGDRSLPADLPAGVVAPYLLHVGDLHERRNLAVVVEAVLAARRQVGATASLSLVLAGLDRGIGDGLCAMAAAAGHVDAVVRLGEVSEPQLLALYRGATALVYPSLYEGFGLPVLEAMACGLVVLGSRAASIPEVLGDAGILLEPTDASAWTSAIVTVVNDGHARERWRVAGIARAAAFTWQRTACMTLDVYRRVNAAAVRA